LGPFKTPAREDDPRLPGPNFYYDQEDLLRRRADRDGFAFTIFRPEAVCGVSTGNPMNLLTAIAVYATLCKHEGIPLRFPGPERAGDVLYQVTDARLLARATAWAGTAPGARNDAFNVTNGDTFRWRHMFPRIADYFGIPHAPGQQLKLSEQMPSHEKKWAEIAAAGELESISFTELTACFVSSVVRCGIHVGNVDVWVGDRVDPDFVAQVGLRGGGEPEDSGGHRGCNQRGESELLHDIFLCVCFRRPVVPPTLCSY
jgi:hypothetical protein